ncbi:MAG: zinc-dependent metalloprotease [Flavobacteriales bacterium]|nr:zinc-dependent metalloprotease [Flavobacteriales bacterium]
MRTLLFSIGIGSVLCSAAQTVPHDHRSCGAQSITQRHLHQHGAGGDLLRLLPAVSPADRGGTYTVPVVVHVVWNTAAENVTTASINAMIAQLNADYSATNSDLGQVRQPFTGVVGNVGFQFCLAQTAPDGSPTTGIVRVQTSDTWFDPDNETDDMKFAGTGSPAWDPTRYLNIWICDITSGAAGNTITVGYAYLPVQGIVGSEYDGLVIDYSYGMQTGSRTATHEIGHYFGLLHPFDENGACVNADGFSDTPTSNSPTYSCSNSNLMKCGVLTQYENFMDYSICTVMFTAQQAAYMAGLLTSTRASLLQSNVCSAPTTGYCIPTSAGGTTDGDYINRVAVGTINNGNTGDTLGPWYTDYSATLSTSLSRGGTYTLTVQGGSYHNDHVAAWIDYDQDESFEAGERLGNADITAADQVVTITFTVPAGATLGNTRLRVRNVYYGSGEPTPTDPCFNYAYGETEDYGITIVGTPQGLCVPSSPVGTADGDYINRVSLGSINNLNSGGPAGPSYTNYTASHSTTLARGTQYTLTAQGGTYAEDHLSAWIDYDRNGTFGENERLGEIALTAANQTVTITFTVPAGTAIGNTVLRVRNVYHNNGEPVPTDPCFSYDFGETEDYGINIVQGGSSPICIPSSANGTIDGDFVNSVILNTIVNVGSGGPEEPTYTDFSATFSTTLVRNGSYGLIIEGGTYTTDSYAAWIDLDQDGQFEAGEKIGEFATTEAEETRIIPFTIPANAPLGSTKMRVRGVYTGQGEPVPVDPCHDYAFGETEDYGITIAPAPSSYCTPYTILGTVDGDFINSVTLASIANLNTGGIDAPPYADHFNTHSTTLLRGNEYSLEIESGDYAPDTYAAWIDMDQNGTFDADELLGQFTTTEPGETGEIIFSIPEDAPVGVTRLRVRGGFLLASEPAPMDPCHPYAYGETEDYQVTIQFGTRINGSSEAGLGLWPNPASGLVTVHLPSEGPARTEVVDMQGRTVIQGSLTGPTTSFDVSGLASGYYLVRVIQNDVVMNARLEVIGH